MAPYPALRHAQLVFQQLAKLNPSTGPALHHIIMYGETTRSRHDTDRELPFRQESNFFYVSGCEVPGAALVLSCIYDGVKLEESKIHTKLFLPAVVPEEVMWCGLPPTAKELAKLITHTSIVEGYSATSLYPPPSPLRTIVHTLPNVPFDKSLISTINGPTHSSVYLLKALHHARRNKTPEELDLMRHAMGITTRAHKDLMRHCGRGETLDEGTAEAGFVKICREGGAREQAYTPIVARGTNAGTLHYIRNGDTFGEEKTVLLVDAGAEYENYASDITRCTPLGNGGKFTKESREIYELVLEMQTFAFGFIKPGGDYEVIQKEMHRIVAEGFLTLGIFKGGSQEEIVQSGLTTAFYPHGVGHLLGLDVHDVGGLPEGKSKDPLCKYLRLRVPLEIGFVVTVEPGIYFNPFLQAPFFNSQYLDHEVLARYQVVGGIRIEDNLVVTESGFENLSNAIPKTVKEVEEYIAGTRD